MTGILARSGVLLGAFFIFALPAVSQPQLPLPQASPAASVTQTIGVAEVRVDYHRPGVRDRQVWGGLVPYGKLWRAGANENTTVSFSHDVRVGGQPLAAGTYGFHTIPTESTWTVIFSKNSTSWGSYYYDRSEDALRLTVIPQHAEHREWLAYEFSSLSDTGAVLSLHWEKLSVPVHLQFDTPALIVAYAQEVFLRGRGGFSWQGYNQAAQYCLQKNIQLDQALKWADEALSRQENFATLRTKAALLERTGRSEEAKTLNDRALTLATEADVNTLGYSYLTAGKVREAIRIFEQNVKANPGSWNVYDSLAEAQVAAGDVQSALANYEKALRLVKDQQNRTRITDTMTNLKAR